MDFSPEQLEKLGKSVVSKPETTDKKFSEKAIRKLKQTNQKRVSQKFVPGELDEVLKVIEKCKAKNFDKVLIVSLDYVGERKENCILVEGNLFYYYQYLFYDSYQMRPAFNGEGLMVILKNKRDHLNNNNKHGKTK